MQTLEKMYSEREKVLAMNYRDRISIEPGKRGSKPCIRGIRITVYDVLEYLASGMSEQETIGDFPDLTQEDIRAYLAFAADRERNLVSVQIGLAPREVGQDLARRGILYLTLSAFRWRVTSMRSTETQEPVKLALSRH